MLRIQSQLDVDMFLVLPVFQRMEETVTSRRQCGPMKSAPGWDSGALISGWSSGSVFLSVCEKGWLGQIRSDCA